ncbi:MAG: hypothetical protein IJH04_12200, partial [Eggerthellaceae bacterium]|nr:hypothetical protein [Eggerthellaceae bacterium]
MVVITIGAVQSVGAVNVVVQVIAAPAQQDWPAQLDHGFRSIGAIGASRSRRNLNGPTIFYQDPRIPTVNVMPSA